ncbi:hypothetical protein RB2654_15220 [Rhodobacterales bacterium HTCC2654]|uniref:Uncharacterized protein n=1 Tax=Maritimibacter alkaliphilus HTCC2654 TaxID=314271 RepID=A3VH93_9RHOB|nr:hypothetical protein RB2654_15220 [Rhodobacterales bacterium HTCC2654] [Maritimibacter alkaliphilus HTCC2654]
MDAGRQQQLDHGRSRRQRVHDHAGRTGHHPRHYEQPERSGPP